MNDKPTRLSERISVLASKFPNGSLLADTDPVAFIDFLITRADAVDALVKAAKKYRSIIESGDPVPATRRGLIEARKELWAALAPFEEGLTKNDE
jgi:hypothetical protein